MKELYENTLITDVHTAAKVYGNTEDTAVYQDATFFVKGDKNLDSVIKDIKKLDINWRAYNLIKSSSNYPALQQSISGIYSISNKLFAGSLIFAGVVVSLLLLLWMNARKKEIAVLLSLGKSKLEIFGQFLFEMEFISIPAYAGSYFLAQYTAEKLGNNILNKVTGNIAKQIGRQSASSQLGGGAEAEGFNKTLSSLDINVLPRDTYINECIEIVDSLTKNISQILSVHSIENLNNDEEYLKINDTLEDILEKYEILANQKKITVNNYISDENIYIGKTALKIILSNLISNAIKYTDVNGVINIGIANDWLYIENTYGNNKIKDMDKIFDVKFDLNKENSNGLGLYIVSNILNNYNIEYKALQDEEFFIFKIKM